MLSQTTFLSPVGHHSTCHGGHKDLRYDLYHSLKENQDKVIFLKKEKQTEPAMEVHAWVQD